MARIITFFLFLLLASGVLSRSNDISLDSLATWNGEKTIRVVSRVPDLVDETEFLALLGRLSMRGYDVKFVGAEYSGEGLVLEASETGGEVIISIKAPGSPKALVTGYIERATKSRTVDDFQAFTRKTLVLPADLHPQKVEALSVSGSGNGAEILFLSDSSLSSGRMGDDGLSIIDQARSGIEESKAIYLSVGQADKDPNIEIAVVWGQDRDISGKGRYTKFYSRLFEWSGQRLRGEGSDIEDLVLRFIDGRLYGQRREPLSGTDGDLMLVSLDDGKLQFAEESESFSGRNIFSFVPVRASDMIHVDEGSLEWHTSTVDDHLRLELGAVSYPVVFVQSDEREIITTPEPAFSINEDQRPVPRKVVTEEGEGITFLRKRRTGFAALSSAKGTDVLIGFNRESEALSSIMSVRTVWEVDAFIIDFFHFESGGRPVFGVLTNEETDSEGATSLEVLVAADKRP